MSNDRTDYNTLIPVLEKHRKAFGNVLEEVTADSGYCSEKNLLYLNEHQITSYIKLQDHEKRKSHAYKEDIGKYYNMGYQIFKDEHYYICYDGGNCAIFAPKERSRTVIPRPIRYMAAWTAVDVCISQSACTNTMLKKMLNRTRS